MDIKELIEKSEELKYGWYRTDTGQYVRVANGQVIELANRLRIWEDFPAFAYDTNDGYGVLITMMKYDIVIAGNDINSIELFPDGYIICNTSDRMKKQLRKGDDAILNADDIYRVENGLFIAVSNGVHYAVIMKSAEDIRTKPIAKGKIKYNEESDAFYWYDKNKNDWIKIIEE